MRILILARTLILTQITIMIMLMVRIMTIILILIRTLMRVCMIMLALIGAIVLICIHISRRHTIRNIRRSTLDGSLVDDHIYICVCFGYV